MPTKISILGQDSPFIVAVFDVGVCVCVFFFDPLGDG